MTLKQAVIAFLEAHDQYETFAKYKISYGTLKDKEMHDDELRAVGVLRDLVQEAKAKRGMTQKVRRRNCRRCGHVHHAVCNRGPICGTMISGSAFGAQLCACPNSKEGRKP